MSVSRRALIASVCLMSFGQAFLIAIEPVTRTRGAFGSMRGIAVLVGDSQMYLSQASSLEDVLSLGWTRLAYPMLLLISGSIGEPSTVVVILQALLSLWAAGLLFDLVERREGWLGATVAAGFFLTNPMTAQWVRIVMTESVFYSIIVIAIVMSHRLIADRALSAGAALLAVAGFASLMRPNGFLLLLSAAFVFFIAYGVRRRAVGAVVLLLAGLAVLPSAVSASGAPAGSSLANHVYTGVVVHGTGHVVTRIEMPAPSDSDDASMSAVLRYAIAHPSAVLRLGLMRVFVETSQVRRHYPQFVNVFFGTATAIYLLLGVLGAAQRRTRDSLRIALIFAAPLALMTAGTFAIPEGRFGWAYLLTLLPLVGGGATTAAHSVLKRFDLRT